jgi:hypothetical protein
MGLWFFEETAPFSFSLADELTEVKAALIRAGAMEDCGGASCEVVDLGAVRLARLAAEGGPDA